LKISAINTLNTLKLSKNSQILITVIVKRINYYKKKPKTILGSTLAPIYSMAKSKTISLMERVLNSTLKIYQSKKAGLKTVI
jgi:hypothetical protein